MPTTPILVAHRGLTTNHPENTIPAFRDAIAAGAEMIELDVHETANGRFIAYHNNSLRGRRAWKYLTLAQIGQYVADSTLAPTLAESLQAVGHTPVDIEIKTCRNPDNFLAEIARVHPAPGSIISSFSLSTLRKLHRRNISLPLMLLMNVPRKNSALRNLRSILLYFFPRLIPKYISAVAVHHHLITKHYIQQLKKLNKQVFVWTVNAPESMQIYINLGVNAIITDDTPRLKQLLAKQ